MMCQYANVSMYLMCCAVISQVRWHISTLAYWHIGTYSIVLILFLFWEVCLLQRIDAATYAHCWEKVEVIWSLTKSCIFAVHCLLSAGGNGRFYHNDSAECR